MAKKNLLSITEIEDKTKTVIEDLNEETFIEDFLGLFDIPKTSITRAKSSEGDFLIRNKARYRKVENNPLHAIDEIEQEIIDQTKKPRYLIATDFDMLYAKDTKTNDSLAIHFNELPTYTDFFLAWNGIEKVDYQKENPADIKAAERFTKLYDELVKINPELAKEEIDGESFNLFLIRSLFLYFSEDTEIIPKGSFTNILKTRTEIDGSNLNSVIKELFSILDLPENQRHETPDWLNEFPYVNGKLFKEPHHDLKFSTFTRKLLIEAGELLNWNEINPDILGAMIQTVANKEERQVSGMHYTSVPNIMKVISPLFLDSLQAEYQRLSDRSDDYLDREVTEEQRRKQQRDIINQIETLIERMRKIKFLDPACGSGNFLIITYKELRRLEIKCLVKIREIREALNEKGVYQGSLLKQSKIKLNQFSGIELDDFAHEVARLSLYISEHQMNVEMTRALADYQPRILPLKESGNIVHANALRVNWNDIIPHGADDEVYIMGNPPYIGYSKQNANQKDDLKHIFQERFGRIDYIGGWFLKAAKYISNTNAKFAFVTTNSVSQGEQVPILWDRVLENTEIIFAIPSFLWKNMASNNAVVTVSVIGIADKNKENKKYIFQDESYEAVTEITPYLTKFGDVVVQSRTKSISNLPEITNGNRPVDGGFLLLSKFERDEQINRNPALKKVIKKIMGADEFIRGDYRYTLWLTKESYLTLEYDSFVSERIKSVKNYRENAGKSAQSAATTPWAFVLKNKYLKSLAEFKEKHPNGKMYSILIPRHPSSEKEYIPMGYLDEDIIISDSAMAIYNAPLWLLGILESKIHLSWLKKYGGRIKTDYRYSNKLVYNTFPIPPLSTQRKNILEEAVLEMLDVREEEGGTLAELYGGANKAMNVRLREAHKKIDGIVERAYKQEPFKSDEERLSVLLKLYQEMVSEEKK